MLYAAIDIHKHAFQAAVLDPEGGEVVEARFSADRESLGRWAEEWQGRVVAVAIEATTGWRWVWRELSVRGFDVRLAEPVQARALLGRRRTAKTDRLDARWLARLLAKEMLPQSWIPPEEIQRLRDRTRLRKTLAEDQRRWGQRLHAFLLHEGWPCPKSRLLTPAGMRWTAALKLSEHGRLQVDSLLAIIAALEVQLDTVDSELHRRAVPGAAIDLRDRADPRLPSARRDRRGVPLPPRQTDHPPGRARPGRRRIRRDAPSRPSRQGRLTPAALGTGRGGRPRESAQCSRPRALPGGARPPRHHGRQAERRAQDRQARLPRPARARTRRRLRRRSRLDAFPPTPEPAALPLLLWNEPSASAFPTRQPARGMIRAPR